MVASEKATIGLNEAKFGLVAPFWFMDSFRNVTGQRVAEFALLNGKLYSVRDAKDIGKYFFWKYNAEKCFFKESFQACSS